MVQLFKTHKFEYDIYLALGPKLYSFIKNVILSNKTKLVLHSGESEKGDLIFNIIYDPETEMRFSKSNETLFHGSNICNWYYIFREGIKSMSGTALQANGAAYGNGIYLSDDYNVSFGYSSVKGNFNNNVTGIVQVLEPKSKYKKTSHYVVPASDETKLLLRKIIVKKSGGCNTGSLNLITQLEFIKLTNVEAKIKMNAIQLRRLDNEIKMIKINTSEKFILSDVHNENEIKILSIILNGFENKSINGLEIKILCINYPSDSPIIYTSSLILSEQNQYILECGIILEEEVIKWKINNKLINVLQIVWDRINEIYKDEVIMVLNESSIETIIKKYSEYCKMKNI